MTERLIKTGKWSEKSLNIAAGVQRQIKAAFPVNVVMLHNESTTDYIYMGFNDNISELNYETRIAPGQWGVLARPYEFISYFVYAANNISNVKHVEAKVEDPLGFVQRIIYGGQITEGIITSTVGLKASDLNLEEGTKNVTVKVASTQGLKASDLNLEEGTKNLIVKLAESEKGKTWQKVDAKGAGDEVVKASPGIVYKVAAANGVGIYIKDGDTQAWKAGDNDFPEGLKCLVNITLNFDGAGSAWILYE